MKGRIRSIKPEVFQDEELWDLAAQTGLPILQGFVGLWCHADREGRFEWRPRALRNLILPYWAGDFETVLDALSKAGFIVAYEVDGKRYAYIRSFAKHQVINQREAKSALPAPPAVTDLHVHARGEGKGRELEGKGREGNDAQAREDTTTPSPTSDTTLPGPLKPGRRERESALPATAPIQLRYRYDPDWAPNREHRARGQELGLSDELMLERAEHCRLKPHPHGFFTEDEDFFRQLLWLRNDQETKKHQEHERRERNRKENPGGYRAAG